MSQVRRLFVCVNQKSGVGEEVAKALKKEVKKQKPVDLVTGERQQVRVQTCNCLDLCKQCKKGPGAALVVYPEGTLYGRVRPDDATELVAEHLGKGRVLKRLHLNE